MGIAGVSPMKRSNSGLNIQLEKERDDLKAEVERLQELLTDGGAAGGDAKNALKRFVIGGAHAYIHLSIFCGYISICRP
jgi:hypothetical protein